MASACRKKPTKQTNNNLWVYWFLNPALFILWISRYQLWLWNFCARAPKSESPIQTRPDTLGLNPAKISTVACFLPSWEDFVFSATVSVLQRAAAMCCPYSGWWRHFHAWLAQPTQSQCKASCRKMQHISGGDKPPGWKWPEGWPRLWVEPWCPMQLKNNNNNLRIVKHNLVIETQVIWQLVKILLIKSIFNSNRNFPHKDILALSAGGKKKKKKY